MRTKFLRLLLLGSSVVCAASEPIGLFEQKFTAINFERGKWTRVPEQGCRAYIAQETGATVDMLRQGTNNLVAFRATKALRVVICGSVAAFDEGFEAMGPVFSDKR